MSFAMSKSEFDDFMQQHPSLSISSDSYKRKSKKQTSQKPNKHSTKYHNIKVYVYEDGYIEQVSNNHKSQAKEHGKIKETFDSLKEYNRWCELKLMERVGNISNLRRQVTFRLQPGFVYNGKQIAPIDYVADFAYKDISGQNVVEDVKGIDKDTMHKIETKDFKLKWKMMMYQNPDIDLRIV